MSFFTRFLSSSIGRKVVMSLTGLFLISFLVVHLIGNLQLIKGDEGAAFNQYAYFMTTNPLIKFISIGLYVMILLHAFLGLFLWWKNRSAKGATNKGKGSPSEVSWASKNMALLGTLILFFIFVHMGDFWYQMKFGDIGMSKYDGFDMEIANLYDKVAATFDNPLMVGVYVFSMLILALHLWHGFASAFQTLGLNHSKYNKLISTVGKIISIVIPAAFAFIPLYYWFVLK